eukprot:scaffold21383_cov86-Isochrysis_galbana.AAC.1
MARLFAERKAVKKNYLALVHGRAPCRGVRMSPPRLRAEWCSFFVKSLGEGRGELERGWAKRKPRKP